MIRRFLNWMSWLPLFLLGPYLVTILCNGVDPVLKNHLPDVEDCVPVLLTAQIPDSYELETLKAQAVIARTNLYRKIQKDEADQILRGLSEEWRKAGFSRETLLTVLPDKWKRYEQAAEETSGQVLTYLSSGGGTEQDALNPVPEERVLADQTLDDPELPLVPYHEMSGGRTRSGAEVFHDEAYSYLVESEGVRKSPDLTKTIYLSKKLLPADLQIRDVDSTGYVLLLQADGRLLEGEAFRLGLLLPSADFSLKETEEEYCFTCRGRGHGLGFSQYGGNTMANDGAGYEEILKVYFPSLQLIKI